MSAPDLRRAPLRSFPQHSKWSTIHAIIALDIYRSMQGVVQLRPAGQPDSGRPSAARDPPDRGRSVGIAVGQFDALYSEAGRPSIPPEKLLRALLLQAFYSVRSERQLMEQLDYNLLYRVSTSLS
jgi:Transposase domain (DUF772)